MTERCSNVSRSENTLDKFSVSHECALFDFVVYTVLMGFLCLFGIVGNTVALIVLLRQRSRSATNFLLHTLAVADCLVLAATVPLYLLPNVFPYTGILYGYHRVYLSIVPFLWPLHQIPYTWTIFLTVLVSLNRYLAVCRPFRSGRHLFGTTGQAKRHVLCLAAFSVVYNIPRFFEYESKEICVGQNASKDVFELSPIGDNKIYRIVYANVVYFLLVHGGPLLSLAFLNVKLIETLKVQQRRRMAMGKCIYHQQEITLVLVVVVFVFIFSQTPTFIDHILWTVISDSQRSCGHWHYYYTAVADTLALLNSSVNFIIYTVTSRKFRRGLMTSSCVAHATFALRSTPERIACTPLPHHGHACPPLQSIILPMHLKQLTCCSEEADCRTMMMLSASASTHTVHAIDQI